MIKQYKFITKSSFDWTDKIKHNIQTWLEQTQTNTDEMRLLGSDLFGGDHFTNHFFI